MAFLLLMAGLLLAGCAPRVHTPRIESAWGRANLVGATAHSDRIGLAVAPDGTYVALAYPVRAAGATQDWLHLLVLDGQGGILVEEDLEPASSDIRDVQLLSGAGGELHLTWRAGPYGERALWYAQLPPVAGLAAAQLDPEQVSPAGSDVRWYKAALFPDGRPILLWSDADGCVTGQLGDVTAPGCLLTGVLGVDFQLDPSGTGHVAWTRQETVSRLVLSHGTLTPETWSVDDRRPVAMVIIPGGASPDAIHGPVVSLGTGYDYISWTQAITNLFGTVEQLRYVAVPVSAERGGLPAIRFLEPQQVQVLPVFPPPTEPVDGDFDYGELVRPGRIAMGSTTVSGAPTALGGRAEEPVQVTSALYNTRSREGYQPTVIYFRDGAVLGYQALTWTDRPSVNAVVAADANHDLYVAWIDAIGESYYYPIYLATTAPDLQAAWRGLTWEDLQSIAWDLFNRVVSGVFLVPLTIIWILLPFVWILGAIIVSHGDLYGNQGRVVLLGALGIYWASKYLLSDQILATLPALGYLPPAGATLAVYLVPVLLLGISCGLAYLVTYRRTEEDDLSTIKAYLITAGIDWALSIAVYAIGYLE